MDTDFSCDGVDSLEASDGFDLMLNPLNLPKWSVVDDHLWKHKVISYETKKPEWFDAVVSSRLVGISDDQLEIAITGFSERHAFCDSSAYLIEVLNQHQEKILQGMVLCAIEREPDREVDNDVQERCRMAVGDYSRSEHERSWSDTAQDAAQAAGKLWEAKQLYQTNTLSGRALAGEKAYEAAEHASRVLEDVGRGIADVAENFVESREKAVEGGYSQNSDMGL